MADITFTDSNVTGSSATKALTGISAEALGIGKTISINRANLNKLYLGNANDLVNTYRNVVAGITLSKVTGAGQTLTYQNSGNVTFGAAVLETGLFYFSSGTNGGIMPSYDMNIQFIVNKALTSNVATLTTAVPHGFLIGQIVTIAGVDGTFNGPFTVASTPSTTTFTYAKTAGNVSTVAVTGFTATAQLKGVTVNQIGYAISDSVMKLTISNTGITR